MRINMMRCVFAVHPRLSMMPCCLAICMVFACSFFGYALSDADSLASDWDRKWLIPASTNRWFPCKIFKDVALTGIYKVSLTGSTNIFARYGSAVVRGGESSEVSFPRSQSQEFLEVQASGPGNATLVVSFIGTGIATNYNCQTHVFIIACGVGTINITSSKLGISPNPPPFPGRVNHVFRTDRSPDVDKHAVVLYKDIVDSSFNVGDFDVTLTASLAPENVPTAGLTYHWTKIEGPGSGELVPSSSLTAVYRNPKKGGVYRFRLVVQNLSGREISFGEASFVLPLAGAEMDGVVQADLAKADIFAIAVRNKYPWLSRLKREYYMKWFYWNNAGDYMGRPDSENTPSVWYYGQVDTVNPMGENFGLGAVCTWKGTPVRLAKISNFLVGYAACKIGTLKAATKAAGYRYGTINGATGEESWNKGWDLAGGGSYDAIATALAEYIWKHESADDKTKRPWPNPNPPDNNGVSPLFEDFNFDRQYASPGLTRMLTNP